MGLYDEVGIPATEAGTCPGPRTDSSPGRRSPRWAKVGARYGLEVLGPPIPE